MSAEAPGAAPWSWRALPLARRGAQLARRVAQALPLAAAAAAGWQAWRLRAAVGRAREIAADARPYEAHPPRALARVLVVGDSTAVGVGAGCAEDSLPGLLACEFPGVQVVNVAVTGARLADAVAQADAVAARGERFDLALLLVGGNDVFRHTAPRAMREQSRALLARLASLAHRTVWLGSANIGGAPVFAPPLSWWFAWRTRRAAALFAREARRAGALFIDFAGERCGEVFARDTDTWFAADGVHPSAASYRHCFEVLKQRAALAERFARPAVARLQRQTR